MKHPIIAVLTVALLFSASAGGQAVAQTLGEIAIGGATIGAGAAYANASRNRMSDDLVNARLQGMGFSEIEKVPDAENQYLVKERNGARYKITLEPVTGNVIAALPQ